MLPQSSGFRKKIYLFQRESSWVSTPKKRCLMHSTSSLFLRKSDAGVCSATRFLSLIMGVLKDKTLANFLIDFFVFYFCDFRGRARGAPSPPLLSLFLSRTLREERKGERRDKRCCHRTLAFVGILIFFKENLLGI